MTIVAIPVEKSRSVREFIESGGVVEIPRPEECLKANCRQKKPLRRNGSYLRQVVYWGILFLVHIFRFRCDRCGKTVSCPYSWLVPYCRFSVEVIAAGIEMYADKEAGYRWVSTELSDIEFADPCMDIREAGVGKTQVEEAAKQTDTGNLTNGVMKELEVVEGRELADPSKDPRNSATGKSQMAESEKNKELCVGSDERVGDDTNNDTTKSEEARSATSFGETSNKCWCGPVKAELIRKSRTRKTRKVSDHSPVFNTVYHWVDFLCDESEELLMQTQKEFVLEWKRSSRILALPPAIRVRNPNAWKAFTDEKEMKLNCLTLESMAAKLLVGSGQAAWQKLRAYFLEKAESCKDILTEVVVVLTRAHTFEHHHY